MNASLALTILPLHICFSLCEKEETDNDLCGTENLEESRRIKKNQVESRIKKNQEEESRRIKKNLEESSFVSPTQIISIGA